MEDLCLEEEGEWKSSWEVAGVGSSHWAALRRAEDELGRIRAPEGTMRLAEVSIAKGAIAYRLLLDAVVGEIDS